MPVYSMVVSVNAAIRLPMPIWSRQAVPLPVQATRHWPVADTTR